jgi:hypothetical protein
MFDTPGVVDAHRGLGMELVAARRIPATSCHRCHYTFDEAKPSTTDSHMEGLS